MNWKIYYADGAEFSSEDGNPQDAPALGVLVICQSDQDNGRYYQCRSDYYVWAGDRWWGVDIGGLYAHSLENDLVRFDDDGRKFALVAGEWHVTDTFSLFYFLQRTGNVKFGKTVDTPSFTRSIKRADTDEFFERRTGWRRDEYRIND
jgi:hypothetical protein